MMVWKAGNSLQTWQFFGIYVVPLSFWEQNTTFGQKSVGQKNAIADPPFFTYFS